jgi:hypothetical protein
MRVTAILLAILVAACGDDGSLQPGRSVRLHLGVAGLPEEASAEYRIFVRDSVTIAHGLVANGEIDTVRVSSNAALKVQWRDALIPIADAPYTFRPGEGEVLIDESERDTTLELSASYTLASGGFILSTPGLPVQAPWIVRSLDGNEVASGWLLPGETLRRGDLLPGLARLELDTVEVEAAGRIFHYYAPPHTLLPLNVTTSLDLPVIEAPYTVVTVVVRVSQTGLPPGSRAPWVLSTSSGSIGIPFSSPSDSAVTFDRFPPGSYIAEWSDVTVDGVTYRPEPATLSATLEPRVEAYDFTTVYAAAP